MKPVNKNGYRGGGKTRSVIAACAVALFAFAAQADSAAPAMNAPIVAVADTKADVSVEITSLGDGATGATITLAYGSDANSMTKTVTKDVTEAGTYVLTMTRLRPGYGGVAQVTVKNSDGQTTTSETFSYLPVAPSENYGYSQPGLYQILQSWKTDFSKDYSTAVESSTITSALTYRRELGTIVAYLSYYGGYYTSEVWGDQKVSWQYLPWGNNTSGSQWIYYGEFYMDASKTYKFRTKVGQMSIVNVTDPSTGETKAVVKSSWTYSASQTTSAAYTPTKTGWYPIVIRFGNDNNYVGGENSTAAVGWSDDSGTTWNKMMDSGDGSILRTPDAARITVAENKTGATLDGLDLSFPATDGERELFVAWGATNGCETVDAWAHTQSLGTIGAGTNTFAFSMANLPADSAWGADDALVLRFYVTGESQTRWSPSYYWYDASAPVVGALTVNGDGGDTLVVSGKVESFSGSSCALKVLTGASADALDYEWTNAELGSTAMLSQAGDFSLTLFEDDMTKPRYITPGSPVYVSVVATADGLSGASATASVTTKAKPSLGTVTVTCPRRTATISGTVTDVGMTGGDASTTLTLYVGTADGVYDVSTNKTSVTASGDAFKFENVVLPAIGKAYNWKILASNVSAGQTATNEEVSVKGTVTTKDTTTYTWTGAANGDWANAANWSHVGVADEDCLGYPQTTDATAEFAANTASEITLTSESTIGALVITNEGASVKFKDGREVASVTNTLTAKSVNLGGTNASLVLDGASLVMPYISQQGVSVAMGSGFTFELKNGAFFSMPWGYQDFLNNLNGGTLRILDGSTVSVTRYKVSGGSETGIRDATFSVGETLRWTGTAVSKFLFEGTRPLLKVGSYFAPVDYSSGYDIQVDFVIPRGGYVSAPLASSGSVVLGHSYGSMGRQKGLVKVNVTKDTSQGVSSKTLNQPLVVWKAGIDTATLSLDNCTKPKRTTLYWADATGTAYEETPTYPIGLYAEIPGSSGLILIVR